MKSILTLFAGLVLAGFIAAWPASGSGYKIINTIHAEGDAGWDYLTAEDSTGRLFVSHGTMVQVVDEKTGKVLGTIPGTNGVHGIALAPDLKKGYISCGKDTAVVIFNLQTLAVITKVTVTGQNPDAILYDAFSHQVFTFNGRSSNATVLDARTDKVTATIALSGKPEFSVTDGKGKVYVNIEDKSLVAVINAKTLAVEAQWPVAPGEEPSGLALDNENHRLFSVCGNKLMAVLDAQTGKVITTLPTGDRTDGAAFDPAKKRDYSSNGEGTLTVVQEESKDQFKVLENVATQKGARTITVDKRTHRIFLPTAEFGPAPEATADNPHPRPAIKPNSFMILVVEPVN
jgi:YVTN family beta-propeller protein